MPRAAARRAADAAPPADLPGAGGWAGLAAVRGAARVDGKGRLAGRPH
jgi:hypothetical protein